MRGRRVHACCCALELLTSYATRSRYSHALTHSLTRATRVGCRYTQRACCVRHGSPLPRLLALLLVLARASLHARPRPRLNAQYPRAIRAHNNDADQLQSVNKRTTTPGPGAAQPRLSEGAHGDTPPRRPTSAARGLSRRFDASSSPRHFWVLK